MVAEVEADESEETSIDIFGVVNVENVTVGEEEEEEEEGKEEVEEEVEKEDEAEEVVDEEEE